MSRARPNAIAPEPAAVATSSSSGAEADDGPHHQEDQERQAVLTGWRKSLLPSCSGFTVFDASGALAFRVDCYGSARCGLLLQPRRAGEVVLMDVAGTPLLTVRRQSRLTSLGLAPDRWLIFDGDAAGCSRPNKAKPFLSVRRARHALLGASASSGKAPLAYVTPLQASGGGEAYVVKARTVRGPARCGTRAGTPWPRCAGRSASATTCSASWPGRASARRWLWRLSSCSTRCSPPLAPERRGRRGGRPCCAGRGRRSSSNKRRFASPCHRSRPEQSMDLCSVSAQATCSGCEREQS